MKKTNYLLIALFASILLLTSTEAKAQTKSKVRLTNMSGSSSGPNNLIGEDIITIDAEFDSQELLLSVTNYSGYSDILIFKIPGHNVMYDDNEYISDSSPLSIDISSYQSGIYVVIVTLDSGEMYTGELLLQ